MHAQSKSAGCQKDSSSWSGFKANVPEFVVSFHPWSRRTPARVYIAWL